jgi:putative ABC transport system substrate-binding protein
MNLASDDAEGQSRNAAFLQGLQQLGWAVGRNVRIDYRWGASNSDPDRMRKDAGELLALAPDVILATTAPIVVALQQVSRTVPIAFTTVIDPVGAGVVPVPAGSGGLAAIQTVAPFSGVELTPVGVRDAGEIERAIRAFARGSNGGLILVGPTSSVERYRDLIIALAARHRLPGVYPTGRSYVTAGGLDLLWT